MKILLLLLASTALIVEKNTDIVKNFLHNKQISIVHMHNSNNINNVTAINRTSSSSSSDYQESAVTLSAVNLSQPHILSIHTSGSQLQGKITFNRKVIKQISGNKVDVNLSPYLSVGEHTVEISARYSPSSSSIHLEFNAPASKVIQQTGGSGVLNSTLKLNVQ